jgi:hypothetical protein
VVSTLGPVRGQGLINQDAAKALIFVMRRAGVRRYVGVTGAGIDVPGDQKAIFDKVLSKVIQLMSRKSGHGPYGRIPGVGGQRPGMDLGPRTAATGRAAEPRRGT